MDIGWVRIQDAGTNNVPNSKPILQHTVYMYFVWYYLKMVLASFPLNRAAFRLETPNSVPKAQHAPLRLLNDLRANMLMPLQYSLTLGAGCALVAGWYVLVVLFLKAQ